MKKLFFTVGISLSICSFTSCSNEDYLATGTDTNANNPTTEANYQSLHAINLKIDSINYVKFGIPSLYDNEPDTKVIFKKSIWAKLVDGFKTILRADAEGALTGLINDGLGGTISGAVTSSIVKAITVITSKDVELVTRGTEDEYIPNDSLKNETKLDEYIQQNPLEYTDNEAQIDSIGIYHNRIITRLFKEHNTVKYWKEATTQDILGEVNIVAEKEIGLTAGRLSKNDSLNHQIILYIDSLKERTPEMEVVYYNSIKENNPTLYKIIEIICEYIDGITEVKNVNEAIRYYNEIMKIIDESGVDEDSKTNLRLALNVAFSSANLWNQAAFSPIQ